MAWYDVLQGLGQGLQQAGQIAGTQRAQRQRLAQEQYSTLSPDVDLTADDVRQLTAEGGIPPSAFVKTTQGTFRRAPTLQEQVAAENLRKSAQDREADAASRTHIRNLINTGQIPADIGEALLASPNAASAYVSYRTALDKPAQTKDPALVADRFTGQYKTAAMQLGYGESPASELTPAMVQEIQELGNRLIRQSPAGEGIVLRTAATGAAIPGIGARSEMSVQDLEYSKALDNSYKRVSQIDPTGAKTLMLDVLQQSFPPNASPVRKGQIIDRITKTFESPTKDPEVALATGQRAFRQALMNNLPVAERNAFIQRDVLLQSLDSVRKLTQQIQNDKSLSEKFGPLQGRLGEVLRKVTGRQDPTIRKFVTELTAALQAYRANVTGKAFSAAESAEYADLLPDRGLRDEPDLMLDTVDSFYASVARNNNVSWASRLGFDPTDTTSLGQIGLYRNPATRADSQKRWLPR